MNLFIAFVLTLVLALLWLRFVDYLALKGVISSQLSRKIIHIGTGPIFVLCWLFFPDQPLSKYIAAIIPLLISVQFFLIGIGLIKDDASVEAMSRSGDPKEILKGPMIYGLVFVFLTIVFWKDNPLGIIALMILCGGDGLADVIGRQFSSKPIPWSKNKSMAGSTAMFLGSFVFSLVIMLIFLKAGVFEFFVGKMVLDLAVLSLVAALLESIPVRDFDNITVPFGVILLGLFIL